MCSCISLFSLMTNYIEHLFICSCKVSVCFKLSGLSLGFSTNRIMWNVNKERFTCLFSNLDGFFFPCLTALARTSGMVLNGNCEREHLSFVPSLRGKTFSLHH